MEREMYALLPSEMCILVAIGDDRLRAHEISAKLRRVDLHWKPVAPLVYKRLLALSNQGYINADGEFDAELERTVIYWSLTRRGRQIVSDLNAVHALK